MIIKIAFRNILRNRRRSAITLLVIVFGAVGLILFGGYKAHTFWALRESTIRNRLGHLQIFAKGYAASESQKPLAYALDDVEGLRRTVQHDPRVKMTAAQITLMGLISNGEKSETFLATAVEPDKDKLMQSQRITAGSPLTSHEPDSALIGAGLAKSMHVKPGDYVTLMTTTITGSLNAMDVRVAGIFTIGVKEYDDRAIKMPIAGAQMLLQTKKVEKLLVFLNNTDDTAAVRASHSESLHGVEFKDWSELATFYHQVVALYNGIFGFLGLIVFAIVIFSVANTILMSVFERTREIGTLMAIGTTRARLWRMFLAEGFSIGVIGCVLGVVSGVVLAWLINHGNVMLPPPPGYTAGYKLQILMSASVLVPAAVIAIVTATLSSIAPAFRASRMKIVDALGHI
jgi:putative ABC transport system permease protein